MPQPPQSTDISFYLFIKAFCREHRHFTHDVPKWQFGLKCPNPGFSHPPMTWVFHLQLELLQCVIPVFISAPDSLNTHKGNTSLLQNLRNWYKLQLHKIPVTECTAGAAQSTSKLETSSVSLNHELDMNVWLWRVYYPKCYWLVVKHCIS